MKLYVKGFVAQTWHRGLIQQYNFNMNKPSLKPSHNQLVFLYEKYTAKTELTEIIFSFGLIQRLSGMLNLKVSKVETKPTLIWLFNAA